MIYTGLDVLTADCIYDIASSGAAAASLLYTSPRADRVWRPASVAAVYLFNPFTLLACFGRPTTTFAAFFTLLSVKHACQAKVTTAAFALAIASYISLHPILLLPPIGLLCYDQLCVQLAGTATKTEDGVSGKGKTTRIACSQELLPSLLTFAIVLVSTFAASTGFLLAISRLLLPSWQFLESVYMTPLTMPDLTPNSGLWWYFFIEMFDAFREFFLGVFWLHMLSYSIPFCIRFRKQPLAAVVLMLGINAVFQPYANVGDVGTWLSSLCLLGHVFECKYTALRYQSLANGLSSMFHPSVHIPCSGSSPVRVTSWTSIPSSVDLCRLRKRQLLLRHHFGVESGAADPAHGHCVRGPSRWLGKRKTRRKRQGSPAGISRAHASST